MNMTDENLDLELSAKLTIIIPTADRQNYLPVTLASITSEFTRFGRLRVIVVDNASNPPVDALMCARFGVELKRYDDRGDVGESINRAAYLADTEYVWVFGDDDLVCTGVLPVVDNILSVEQPDVIYLNRYIANHNLNLIERTEHPVEIIDMRILSGAEASIAFTHHPGFISAVIFRKTMLVDTEECEIMFPGFGFMAAIYKNSLRGKFVLHTKPWVVQRRSESLWKSRWPRFWLVTLPKMFEWLESTHGVNGALDTIKLETNRSAVRTLLAARANGYVTSDKFWRDAGKYLSEANYLIAKVLSHMPIWSVALIYRFLFIIKKAFSRVGI